MNRVDSDKYRERLHRVLDYIDTNLERKLTLDQLSGIAAFLKYHFQRQFTKLFGISPHTYIRWCRFKRAAHLLAFRTETPVTEIALNCGYESPEPFTRAFRKSVGRSPSAFRQAPCWDSWNSQQKLLSAVNGRQMKSEPGQKQVDIVEFENTKIAVLTHRGDPKLAGNGLRNAATGNP